MRPLNIVLFSSGVSSESGILGEIQNALEEKGYICSWWRDLFQNANDAGNIALLPMLIKKIPTFDFAILICEGHDITWMKRHGEVVKVKTMRDNVVFEIGLCTMALGIHRTILITDSDARLPDDLTGRKGQLALKRFIYEKTDPVSWRMASKGTVEHITHLTELMTEIDQYIQKARMEFSPVIVGAAATTASGYVENFIFRLLERIDEGVCLSFSTQDLSYFPDDQIYLHILLPAQYTQETPLKAHRILQRYPKGYVPSARFRKAEFHYSIEEGNLHIFDSPTSIVTSYSTARMILQIDADDSPDIHAQDRFIAKEMSLFESTLHILLTKRFLDYVVRNYYHNQNVGVQNQMSERIAKILPHITIEHFL